MKKLLVALIVVLVLITPLVTKQTAEPDNKIKQTPVVIKPDPVVIVKEIQKLARLETASVNSERVISGERNQDQLWGTLGETMTFVAYGQVIAGVDLSNFMTNDIVVIDSTTVKIKLPKAEIFSVTIDNQKSYVASRNKGFLASTDKDMESRVRQQAESDCRKNALDQAILAKADANAKDFIKSFLLSYGLKNVLFTGA